MEPTELMAPLEQLAHKVQRVPLEPLEQTEQMELTARLEQLAHKDRSA
jgi:hypothetical protein